MAKRTLQEQAQHVRDAIEAVRQENDQLERRALDAESQRSGLERELAELQSRLSQLDGKSSLRVLFEFPSPVRNACEQYLVYFAEFLRDLGIEASTELRESAGSVLFEITPNSSREALIHIREALELYLQLPTAQFVHTDSTDAAVQKLTANVFYFKSRLALVSAVVQAQQTTIEAQQTTIDAQRQMLSGEVVAASMVRENKETLFGGLVDIVPVESKGLRLNLPQLIRELRKKFRK